MWLLLVNYVFLILLTRTGSSSGSKCPSNSFDCGNGKCISELWRCDEDNDCGNLNDELDCDNYASVARCLSSQFACESDQHCIPQKWHCDGDTDCEDGSDEKKCDNVTECTGFTCQNHQCIPAKWRCDGNLDCKDGSDEELCPLGRLCADSEFLCSSGSCVNRTLICDGKKDCIDGSDEGSHCVDHCENSTCSQNCRSTPSGPQCFCNDGYMLDAKDNKTCTDIDECLQEGFCSHQCTNTPGGYRCSCLTDYELVNRTCQAKGGDPLLIFSTQKDIRAMRLRANEYFLVRRAVSSATALDVDPKSQQIFWVEVSTKSSIMSAKTDETSMKTVLSHGLQVPEDIAVDYVANNLYLTDSGLRQVIVCKVDGTMCHVLHDQNVEKPRSIVLDLSEGLLYWSDWGEHAAGIYRSGMDGSRRIPLISNGIAWPNSIAIDHTTNRLYWADAKLKTIEYVNLDGSSRKVVLNATVFHPYSLTVFEDTIYWSDWSTFALESCNKFTGHRMTALAKENGRHIMGLHVYHPVLTAKVSNPCWASSCSHMCLISPVFGFRCACPLGFQLAEDSRTCKMEEIGEAIFVNEGSSVFYIRPGVVGKETINEMSLPLSTVTISKVAFDKNLRFLFVADVSSPAIYAVNMTSLHMKVLIRSGIIVPEDLSFDWRSNNLYWIDSGKETLEVISVDSLKRAVIIENLTRPVALAISPKNGHMFVATVSSAPSITMYDMDGRIMKVLASVLESPMSLALHPSKSVLYWADPSIGTIFYANYTHSGSPRILQSGIDGVIGVAASEENVYWTNRKREVHYMKGGRVYVLQLPGEERGIATRKVTYSSGKTGAKSACMIGNGGCSYLCLTSSKGITCACPPELILAADNATCTAKDCEASDFKCMDGQCLPARLRCDGNKNCDDGSDETGCSRCPGSDFQCRNGRCILKSWHCDGRNDCVDNSDEEGCTPTNCRKDQTACSNGECISVLWRCDGDPDCLDGSDETNCNATRCDSDTHFRCDNGQCISISWVCDKAYDCKDNSDERNCGFTKTCTVHEFKCESDGTCIDELMKCDGRANCKDGSDEINCPKNLKECKEGMYECNDGNCIYDYEVCDGHGDCSNKEEELNCSAIACAPDSYFCPSSKHCIVRRWICDGDIDCADGSDEDNCGKHKVTPKPTQAPIDSDCDGFYCYATHQCLAWSRVCDGHQDCEALQDEGGLCSRSCHRNNGGCSQSCWKTPYGPRCSCKEGYSLNLDNKTCEDVDECQTNGSCSHYCQNTKGGFKCSCADGYILQNNRHCKADGGPGIVVYLLGDQIRGYNLGNGKYSVYVETDIADAKGMDYDQSSDVFFWTEEKDGSINSYSRKSRERNVILRSSSRPIIVRYDWIARNLYYRDRSSAIVACSVDGKYCKTIIQSSNTNIDSMDISPTNGLMFWTIWANSYRDQHSGQIERAEMDGSHRIVIAMNKLEAPTGIAVDHVLKLIYWSDKLKNTLECADFNGFGRRRIVETRAYHPFAVAIFEDDVYWTDWGSDSIIKCNRFTGKDDVVVINTDVTANALMILHDVTKPKSDNKCLNNSCMHLCLLTRSNYECVCDDNDDENGTCSSSLISIASLSTSVSISSSTTSRPRISNNRSVVSLNTTTSSASPLGLLSASPSRLLSASSPGLSSTTISSPGSSKSPLSSECPKDHCQDGSECVVQEGEYVCKCTPPYSGKTCEVKAAASTSEYDYHWVIALVFGLVMTGVIIAGIMLCVRNREKLQRVSETVSVKFCKPKNDNDGRLVMDTDDGSLCEELVIEEEGECRKPSGESDYCAVDSEDGDLRKWPHDGRDSSLNANVANFFRKLKLNASAL